MTAVSVQPGDFACVHIRGLVGVSIELASWLDARVAHLKGHDLQPYEHAEIYIGGADAAGPHGYTASAYPDRRGIQPLPCPPEQMPGALWSSGLIPLTGQQRDGIVKWCWDHPRVRYSASDYLALVLHRMGMDTRWLQCRIENSKSLICSQYTDSAYGASGVHLFDDGRWPGFVTPLDLALLLESRQGQLSAHGGGRNSS